MLHQAKSCHSQRRHSTAASGSGSRKSMDVVTLQKTLVLLSILFAVTAIAAGLLIQLSYKVQDLQITNGNRSEMIFEMFQAEPAYKKFKDLHPNAAEEYGVDEDGIYSMSIIQASGDGSRKLVLELFFVAEDYRYGNALNCYDDKGRWLGAVTTQDTVWDYLDNELVAESGIAGQCENARYEWGAA